MAASSEFIDNNYCRLLDTPTIWVLQMDVNEGATKASAQKYRLLNLKSIEFQSITCVQNACVHSILESGISVSSYRLIVDCMTKTTTQGR